ncbi:actin interacting protein 3-domain-containing protein [Calycina marina]|uniref:Actin interacting protein 3-domain-containing protein n=1 Tax=Calycina marina TaxID=1763456 RepID=A0A9P7YYW8_9HELO|nr:actin interacting protein 3-domain-containing protein [Calycina marina]
MQQQPVSARSVQRKSPPEGFPDNMASRSMSPSNPNNIPHSRASNASSKSTNSNTGGAPKRQNMQMSAASTPTGSQNAPPLSQIEKSVTHLLVATKQLLETLTQWSRHHATDAQVSDVYVRLGYEFNIACRAFTAINVDTSDLGNVPELLRHILESTLSQEASVESLEKYLPRIRDIIINLLHGLKRKQQKLRQKQARDGGGDGSMPRNSSVSSTGSASTGLTTLLDQGLANNFNKADTDRDSTSSSSALSEVPPRMSSAASSRKIIPPRAASRGNDRNEASLPDGSTLSSNTIQNMPVLPPYPGDETPMPSGAAELSVNDFPPPPPPPKQTNALAALQRGGDLERRASRRYSAYQISKHLNASPGGMPMLPTSQNSPIPNRGRNDARESMRAVQIRGERHAWQNPARLSNEPSPVRIPIRISEESPREAQVILPPKDMSGEDSPTVKTPDDKLRQPDFGATLKGPSEDSMPIFTVPSPTEPIDKESPSKDSPSITMEPSSLESHFIAEQSPPLDKELTVFLQYKTKVKKHLLPDGYKNLSIAKLQLAFIEKFAWNTHSNGVDLPEIYIQDLVSGVRHELEDLADIKDRSVLVLNIEVLDEVKRHFDEGLGGLKKMVEGFKTTLEDQQVTIQQVSERQQDVAKDMARLAVAPVAPKASYTNTSNLNGASTVSKIGGASQISEIQSLRRDLAVLRQTYSGFQSDVQTSMALIRTKAASVKDVAEKAATPDLTGTSGRAYVNAGKRQLQEDSDELVTKVDDLQDIVEDLRKDVVLRGVRPHPRQLQTVARDVQAAHSNLKKLQEYIKREKKVWTDVWEKELDQVCADREDLTMQEDIATDLDDDLKKATAIFALVEQATKEQMKDLPPNGSILPTGRPPKALNIMPTSDPSIAKEGVLGEVRALQPNHENRLEAIERAEKLRQKELEERRGGEFQKELGNFVEEGRLKKSGGFEEAERARKAKDDRARKDIWERQNGMTATEASFEPELVVEPVVDGGELGEPADF